jgi:hypothetical protein
MMRGGGGGEQKCTKMDEIGRRGGLRGRIKEGLGMDLCWIGHFMGEKQQLTEWKETWVNIEGTTNLCMIFMLGFRPTRQTMTMMAVL